MRCTKTNLKAVKEKQFSECLLFLQFLIKYFHQFLHEFKNIFRKAHNLPVDNYRDYFFNFISDYITACFQAMCRIDVN